ncbi:hypothetical protein CYMTET_37936 [Cymbomonas tetramitiformis]|uniref:ABC transporter domain-containing protein n=1 Tax=Cymbomonas tetramitiformis TaxID=36881 RepID=A0AAE0F655_9CHLO|nr:hypothetical protein CYMTET_37936 [Cymbomonas tetramitiformis]|eukprot:gene12141-14346_t
MAPRGADAPLLEPILPASNSAAVDALDENVEKTRRRALRRLSTIVTDAAKITLTESEEELPTQSVWTKGETQDGGVEIIGHDLTYTVMLPKSKTDSRREMTLLSGVNFLLRPGNMCALMGASGAGKSTLLDVVAGRKSEGKGVARIDGDLLFNNQPRSPYFKRLSAYVMQDDVHMASLSVQETLWFASCFRMGEETTDEMRQERVDMLLKMLGIEHIRDSMVGDQTTRGISGGQRKRLSIGVEIVALPPIIFLDEPTSGLDSEISFNVMASVREVADQERTICTTIHQPSPETFSLFDYILLLAHGKVVYFGLVKEVVNYFSSPPLAFEYIDGQNPADFVVHVAGGNCVPPGRDSPFNSDELSQIYGNSPVSAGVNTRIQESRSAQPQPTLQFERVLPTSFLTQFSNLFKRGVTKLHRDEKTRKTVVVRTLFGALLIASLFYDQDRCGNIVHGVCERLVEVPGVGPQCKSMLSVCSDDCVEVLTPELSVLSPIKESCQDCSTAVYNRMSVLFFSVLFMMMASMSAIADLTTERTLYYRERSAGCYQSGPYLGATTIVMIPLLFVTTMMFSGIFYWMIGFYANVESYVFFCVNMFLCNMLGYQLAQLLAACTPSADIALAIYPVCFIFFNIFAGFLIHIPNIPAYWKWAAYISFVRWAIEGLVVNEFEDQDQLRYYNGRDVLDDYGYANFDKWSSVYILFAIFVALRIVTLACLQYVRWGST